MDYSRKIVPPSYDVVFKAIFGREENKPLIISLLSSILTINIHDLEDIRIMNAEMPVSQVDEKGSRLDLRLKLKDKTEIDVEIQSYNHAAFSERVLYYWSKLYINDFKRGEPFKELNKCIVINFLDFRLYDDPAMHAVFKIYEASRHLLFTEHLEIHMIELPKIEGYNINIDNPLLIRWMEFLNVRSEHDMADLKTKDDLPEEILKALDELDKLSQDPNMRMEALNKEMWIRDQIGLIRMAKDAEIKGRQEGREEGREEKTLIIAKNLKNLGIDTEIIQASTGLDVKTIESL